MTIISQSRKNLNKKFKTLYKIPKYINSLNYRSKTIMNVYSRSTRLNSTIGKKVE